MSEWKPIETYDKLKEKPRFAVFWIKESGTGMLSADVVTTRTFGRRTVTHWMPIEPPSSIEG